MYISQAGARLSSSQQRELHEKRIALHRRIHTWRQIQMVYMPCVAILLSSLHTTALDNGHIDDAIEKVENASLWLPSSLPASLPPQLRTTGISPGLVDKEIRLRAAQADDALAEIRRQRRILTGLVLFKKLTVSGTGQKKNTKMRTLFKRFNNKTQRAAERYRAARDALAVMDPNGDWRIRLQVLRAEDIRGPGREPVDKKERRPEMCEKRREESWIWLVPRIETAQDIGVMEEHLDANLRVEWAKSRARAARWGEEVDLLSEEMRRTLTFLQWRADWWRCQVHCRADAPEDLRDGLVAYAERQATLLENIADGHAKHWLPILRDNSIVPDWAAKYEALDSSVTLGKSADDNFSDTDTDDAEGEQDDDESVVVDDYELDT